MFSFHGVASNLEKIKLWIDMKKNIYIYQIHKVNNLLIGESKRTKYLITVGKNSGQV